MAISTCTVSGTIKDVSGTAIAEVVVKATLPQPLFHADGTLIPAYQVSTTTDASGNWSLTLIETATITATLTISIDLPDGAGGTTRKNYPVTVPNSASANFSDLV